MLYYCLEACPLKKAQLDAIDFALNSTFRKIFSTRSQEVVEMCKQIFGCLLTYFSSVPNSVNIGSKIKRVHFAVVRAQLQSAPQMTEEATLRYCAVALGK